VDRIFAVFIIPNKNELHVRVSTEANGNSGIDTDAKF